MKKPLFNLFYSLSVNKITRGGGGGAPSAAPSAAAETGKITSQDRKDVLDYIDAHSASIRAKSMATHGIFNFKDKPGGDDTMITLEFTKGYTAISKRLENLKKGAVKKVYSLHEKAELEKYKIKIKQQLDKIEQEIDILKNKIELQKELKKIAQASIELHLENWKKDEPTGIKESTTKREILIITTGYIGRWYKVNSTAISKLSSLKAVQTNLKNFKASPLKGELFDDLVTINKEIEDEVYTRWITGMEHKDVLRTVFSKLGWEDKFMKDIKDEKLRSIVKTFNSSRHNKDQDAIIASLFQYIAKNSVPGNLPDFPGRKNAIHASGIQAGVGFGTLRSSATVVPSKKLPEAPLADEQRETYIKQYRAVHEAELKKLKGVTFKPMKETGAYKDDIIYQILKDGKPVTRTYYRPNKAHQYGLSSNATYLNGGSIGACSKENITLLKKQFKLEALTAKDRPKIAKMKVVNGNLNIVGENLPNKPITIKLPASIRSTIKQGVKYEATDVGKIIYTAGHINEQIVKTILKSVPNGALRDQLVKALKDPAKGAPILQEILKTGKKPKLLIIGRASMDGRFSGNKEIALSRARNAAKKIRNQIGNAATVVPVGEVVGPDGDKITNLTQAYMMMTKMWNKLPDAKKKIKSNEMKKIVKNYVDGKTKGLTKVQIKFLREKLNDQRGIQVEVVAPNKPKQFTITFTNSAPSTAIS